MKGATPLFTSASVEWGTPPDLYAALDREFNFTLDPCTPDSVWDGRLINWRGERVFCNPPYGNQIPSWLAKGREADVAVYLLPARTDTGWFHDHALGADEIRFFRGRLSFSKDHITPRDGDDAAPFPSMLVIFDSFVATANETYRSALAELDLRKPDTFRAWETRRAQLLKDQAQ